MLLIIHYILIVIGGTIIMLIHTGGGVAWPPESTPVNPCVLYCKLTLLCLCAWSRYSEAYTWTNPTCCVHNIIVGQLWIEQYGNMEVINHK